MAKVIMTCGKICCGKSTYAQQLRKKFGAVILSVDEITLALLGKNAGDKLDEYVEKLEKYFFEKSIEIVKTGINVILDWGFWTKAERDYAKEFYKYRNIDCEFHYIDVSDEVWKQRIQKRNEMVESGQANAYFLDDGLAKKVCSVFEIPERDKVDLWIDEF